MIKPPEYTAYINLIEFNAFALRFERRNDVEVPLLLGPFAMGTIKLFKHVTKNPVCDAQMFISPFVMVTTPLSPQDAASLLRARLSVSIDGEAVVDNESLGHFLVRPPFQRLGDKGPDSNKVWVGEPEDRLLGTSRMHFLPSGSVIVATLELAGVDPEVHLTAGAIMATYTSKARQGALNGVGVLDANQNAYPVQRSWNEVDPDAPCDAMQAKANHLVALADDVDLELKRKKEDEELRKKAEKPPSQVVVPPSEEINANLEKTLSRATKRLVTFAIAASLLLAAIAGAVIYFADSPFILK